MRHWLHRKLPACTITLLFSVLLCGNASARDHGLDRIDLKQVQSLFPAAVSLAASAGDPPTREVFSATEQLGYLFFSDDLAPIPAYSGRPIRSLIALGMDARIRGVLIVHHEEPILVIGVTDNDLSAFIAQYRELEARDRVRIGAHNRVGYIGVDAISGATITSMVLNSSIMKSAKMVADTQGLPRPAPAAPSLLALPPRAPLAEASLTARGFHAEDAETEALWVELWKAQSQQLLLLLLALLLLMGILFFQDWLVVHARLFHRVRMGYLIFTVFYLGFYSQAQLSIVNLLAFMRIMVGGFTWETLLIDPMNFVLWGFVTVSIILWGRGVFCGWLCPFGALQELIHKVAEQLSLPNFEFPAMVHERLWAIKYLILIALVGLSLDSMHYAATLAEVEPFKTTFVLRFDREPWFVAYAWLLLLISAFNSKFYCKYLCPLGAGLSFFTRFRIFDWLRRRGDCGKPCQSCAAQCQIAAIKPTGEIIDNECHYCLECQVTYWDDHRCPPLVEKRKKWATRKKRSAGIIARD